MDSLGFHTGIPMIPSKLEIIVIKLIIETKT